MRGGNVCEFLEWGGFGAKPRRRAHIVQDEGVESARRSTIKLADGDVRGAVRLLCSVEQGVPPDSQSLGIMSSKHPVRTLDRRALPKPSTAPFMATIQEMMLAVKSFPYGSSGGVDSLRPQHLQDMLQGQIQVHLGIRFWNL